MQAAAPNRFAQASACSFVFESESCVMFRAAVGTTSGCLFRSVGILEPLLEQNESCVMFSRSR
jgi:hypothetical protein